MPTYRLYRLDGAGNIVSADWLEAATDEQALGAARRIDGAERFELWERNRLVGNYRSHDGGPTPD